MAKVDINTPTLPSTTLLPIISKIETPSAQGPSCYAYLLVGS